MLHENRERGNRFTSSRDSPRTRASGSLSAWIDAQAKLNLGAQDRRPTSKQVAFAERLARIKRRAVPDECFRDKGLMSKWIDGNK